MSRIKAKERRSSIGRQRLKSNQRPVKRAVRIVVEGIKTEKIYFNAVRRKGSLTATDVIVVDCGSDNSATQVVQRPEEHTSELQSLMRISYAVFCLKKTKKT